MLLLTDQLCQVKKLNTLYWCGAVQHGQQTLMVKVEKGKSNGKQFAKFVNTYNAHTLYK